MEDIERWRDEPECWQRKRKRKRKTAALTFENMLLQQAILNKLDRWSSLGDV